MTFLLDCSLRAAIIVGIALFVIHLLPRASAAARHSILAISVLCAAALPLMMFAVPELKLQMPADIDIKELAGISKPQGGNSDSPRTNVPAAASGSQREALPVGQFASQAPLLPDEKTNTGTTPAQNISYFWIFWSTGALLTLTILLTGWLRLAWIAWRCSPVSHGEWFRNTHEIARDYRLRRRICLLQSEYPAMLATWGLLRPRVVLPKDAEHWHADRIQVVLRHELAHVRRHDWLVQTISELLRAVCWFNPLMWMACARLRRESEQACDDIVLNSGVTGSDYAAHLLDLARSFRGPRPAWSPALLMARESTLERRFAALLNPGINRRSLTRIAVVATAILFLGLALPIAALRVSAQEVLTLELPFSALRAPLELVSRTVLPQQTGSGSMEGYVVRMDTGEVLSSAHVELQIPGTRDNSRVTATATDGRFIFQDIPAGDYQLVAAHGGGFLPAEYGQRSTNGRGLTIKLDAGQRIKDLRVALAQPGSISGRVFDRDGEPVGRAQVQALRTVYVDGQRSETIAASVATDERGEYRLYWLPPGQYLVSATPQDVRKGWVPVIAKSLEAPSVFYTLLSAPILTRRVLDNGEVLEEVQVPVYFPGTTDSKAASSIELRAGANLNGIDMTVAPPIRTHRIRGLLIDASTGQSASSGFVSAVPLTGAANSLGVSGRVDRNGRFEISGVLPGSYLLSANASFDGDPFGKAGNVSVTLGDGDLENISVSVSAGFDLPVKVTVDGRPAGAGLSFRLQASSGSAAPFIGGPGLRAGSPQRNLFTEKEFTIEGVKPGDYRFAFFGMGGSPQRVPMQAYVKSIRMGSVDVLNGILHVDGPPQSPIEIVIGTNVGTLEGTVLNDKQETAANVSVAVVPDAPYRARSDLYKFSTTDAAGHFQVVGIAPGAYRVFSWDGEEGFGVWQDPEFLRLYEGRGRPIHFSEGSRESIRLTMIK